MLLFFFKMCTKHMQLMDNICCAWKIKIKVLVGRLPAAVYVILPQRVSNNQKGNICIVCTSKDLICM